MTLSTLLLLLMSLVEVLLLGAVLFFFARLRKSEAVLASLQSKQEELLAKLRFNAQLEQELVGSFQDRQKELMDLDARLEERARELGRIIRQAEEYQRSPQFLREAILKGRRAGRSAAELSRELGLSVDEVELIIGSGGSGASGAQTGRTGSGRQG